MQTTHSTPEKGTDQEDPFTATEPIQHLDRDAYTRMRGADALVEEGTAVYAVAQRHGVMTIVSRNLEFEATATLYLTADGKQAVERYTRRGQPAPRACIVDEDDHLVNADPHPKYIDTLGLHPEVA
jgi:hypothetical protein